MNINYASEDNRNVQEVEYVEKSEVYSPKKLKKADFFMLIFCILAAFAIWCYANFINDPIIVKEVTVDFVLVDAHNQEVITPSKVNIEVYGEKSILDSIRNNTITVYVERSEFESYNSLTTITIEYPDGIHSHKNQIQLKLLDLSVNSND